MDFNCPAEHPNHDLFGNLHGIHYVHGPLAQRLRTL
jgi:hypothetical protein